jgi:hypothetical protein
MDMDMLKTQQLDTTRTGDAADRDRVGRLVLARMKTLEESFADVIKEMRELRTSTAPTTRRNSIGDGGVATIEVAGRDRPRKSKAGTVQKRVSVRRPGSRRSMKESSVIRDPKGKGKGVARPDDDEQGFADESFLTKGSSF